jgi:hypothetical protein
MRFELRLFAIAALLLAVIAASCQRQSIAEVRRGVMPWERETPDVSRARDFDFLVGSWEIANRRLKQRRVGSMLSPVVGSFRDGIGEFYGDDTDGGKPVRVRFLWRVISKDTAHWEQAFSLDGGKTWETNWVMDLLRIR